MQLTLCIWFEQASYQVRLLSRSPLPMSSWTGVGALSRYMHFPVGLCRCNWAITSCPDGCQSLLTGISTGRSISRESWSSIWSWWASRGLRHWSDHSIRHRKSGDAGLLTQGPVTGDVAWGLFELLLLGCRSWEIIEDLKFGAVSKIALPSCR